MHKNIQTRLNPECDQVFFIFTGREQKMHISPLDFFKETKILNRNLVIFRHFDKKSYFNGIEGGIDSLKALIDWQKQFLKEHDWIKKIYTIGSSAGSMAAVLSGHYLKADAVWTFGLVTRILPVPRFCKGMQDTKLPRFIKPWRTLKAWNGKTTYHLYHCRNAERDFISAYRFRGCEGVSIHKVEGSEHNVVKVLLAKNGLKGILPCYSTIN